MTGKPVRDGETAQRIAATLRDEIIQGVQKPGAVLVQQDLAARFRSSRIPVRDSLRILEREGLVVSPANKTATVAPLDPASFAEINEMRAVAEPLALKHAIPELSNRQLEFAADLQEQAETSDIQAFGALNKAFHMALFAPCNRPRLLAHISTLNDLSQRYFQTAATEYDHARASHAEHRALLAACAARDADRACRILERHIVSASELTRQAMGAGGAATGVSPRATHS